MKFLLLQQELKVSLQNGSADKHAKTLHGSNVPAFQGLLDFLQVRQHCEDCMPYITSCMRNQITCVGCHAA
jgi:hypothetical protein